MTAVAGSQTSTDEPKRRHRRQGELGTHVAGRVTGLQRRLLAATPDPNAVSALARLRRAIGREPGFDYSLEEHVGLSDEWLAKLGDRSRGGETTHSEHATHAAVTLYALHQQSQREPMHINGRGLGRAIGELAHKSGGAEGVRRRFAALGTAISFGEALYHLRSLIVMLREHKIPLDYGLLTDDLRALRLPGGRARMQATWGREFYRSRQAEAVSHRPDFRPRARHPRGEPIMIRTIIDVHALQTVPPSNLNRDDTGSPKTAVYGGVRRARVSSQAWKRAIRLAFADVLDHAQLGERTKRVGESLAERIMAFDESIDRARAIELANEVFGALGLAKLDKKKSESAESGYLLFLSHRQLHNLAAAAVEATRTGTALDKAKLKALANTEHSVDIAMFGRMVADMSDINVDAACQVAHAISVHGVENEFDYFTAVDDRKHDAMETGAGMIGNIEFNSSTLYRYATVDVDRLHETLGDAAATRAAVEAFVTAFVRSMPAGKQNTFAHRTLPDAVLVRVRDTQPINLVGAFEKPVSESMTEGRVKAASAALAQHLKEVEKTYGDLPVASWVLRVGDGTAELAETGAVISFPELVPAVGDTVATRLGQPA